MKLAKASGAVILGVLTALASLATFVLLLYTVFSKLVAFKSDSLIVFYLAWILILSLISVYALKYGIKGFREYYRQEH